MVPTMTGQQADAMSTTELYASLPRSVMMTPREVCLYLDVTPEQLRQWSCRDRKDGGNRAGRNSSGQYDLRTVARTLLAKP